jgi:hypothetical protein
MNLVLTNESIPYFNEQNKILITCSTGIKESKADSNY